MVARVWKTRTNLGKEFAGVVFTITAARKAEEAGARYLQLGFGNLMAGEAANRHPPSMDYRECESISPSPGSVSPSQGSNPSPALPTSSRQ